MIKQVLSKFTHMYQEYKSLLKKIIYLIVIDQNWQLPNNNFFYCVAKSKKKSLAGGTR